MKYQKIINLLDDTMNEPFKFKTRNWVEINDESRVTYNDDDNNDDNNNNNNNDNIKVKTSVIR